jgi:hypothetical protein
MPRPESVGHEGKSFVDRKPGAGRLLRCELVWSEGAEYMLARRFEGWTEQERRTGRLTERVAKAVGGAEGDRCRLRLITPEMAVNEGTETVELVVLYLNVPSDQGPGIRRSSCNNRGCCCCSFLYRAEMLVVTEARLRSPSHPREPSSSSKSAWEIASATVIPCPRVRCSS